MTTTTIPTDERCLILEWRGNRFTEVEHGAVKHRLQNWLHRALRYKFNSRSEEMVLTDFESNPNTVNAALATLKAHVHLPVTVTSPSWLRGDPAHPSPRELLPCRTVLLHLPTMRHLAPTPAFFTVNALNIIHTFITGTLLLGVPLVHPARVVQATILACSVLGVISDDTRVHSVIAVIILLCLLLGFGSLLFQPGSMGAA